MAISITEKAAVKVQDYLKQVSDPSLALRIFVKAGGCAGYQFGLKLDKTSDSDIIEHKNGVNIVADPKSADLLGDAEKVCALRVGYDVDPVLVFNDVAVAGFVQLETELVSCASSCFDEDA